MTRWVLVGAVVLSCMPGRAWADSEVDLLMSKLVEKGILTQEDAGQIRKEIAQTKEDRNKQLAKELVPESARTWVWNGDIRLREEYRNRTGSGQDINRQRIRFRYGFDAKLNDQLHVGARLATGSSTDPISTNQSFNTAFNRVNFTLDRAFLEYTPEIPGVTQLRLTGGIMENPFWVPGPLVFDDDLNFDGLAGHLAQDISPMVTLFTHNGVFPLQTDVSEAATLWGTQGGIVLKPFPDSREELMKNTKFTTALAYYDYKNVTNPLSENAAFQQAGGGSSTVPSTLTAAVLKGNSADVQDFNLLNPGFELASQYREMPFSLFGDWVHNTSVTAGNDGFQIGVKLGKAKVPFDVRKGWEGGYYFERLAPDATFGPFAESDFGGGGTNHHGHVYWIKLATLKNSSVQVKYFNTQELKGAKNHADTFQADWVTKF